MQAACLVCIAVEFKHISMQGCQTETLLSGHVLRFRQGITCRETLRECLPSWSRSDRGAVMA